MDSTGTKGTTSPGRRTFDCPWCGAITTIPEDYLGDHLTCPECSRATKLTEKNTSSLPPTAPPPDAPHLTGDRTFDCPWCGAISSVPSSHLGEHYSCPECKKGTKLTDKTTRRAAITDPPPDAPPPEWEVAARRRRIFLTIALLAAAGIGIAIAVGSGATDGDESTRAERPPTPVPGPDVPPTPGPDVRPPGPPPAASSPEVEASARLEEAEISLAAAGSRLATAQAALKEWEDAHPERLEARQDVETLAPILTESKRLLEGVDPATATPAQARAYNAGMAAFVAADLARVKVVDRLLALLRQDPVARSPSGVPALDRVNFFLPSIREGLVAMHVAAITADVGPPREIVSALDEAQANRNRALESRDDAARRLEEARGGK